MYVAGFIADLHPTLFEALCLVEGFKRLGLGENQISWLVGRAKPGSVTLLGEPARETDEQHLFLRVRAPRAFSLLLTTEVLTGRTGAIETKEDEAALHQEVEWCGCVGPIPSWDQAETEARWKQAETVMSAAPRFEAEPLWEGSRARKVLPGLENVLRAKGFAVRI
jgi:hypothetical protein